MNLNLIEGNFSISQQLRGFNAKYELSYGIRRNDVLRQFIVFTLKALCVHPFQKTQLSYTAISAGCQNWKYSTTTNSGFIYSYSVYNLNQSS